MADQCFLCGACGPTRVPCHVSLCSSRLLCVQLAATISLTASADDTVSALFWTRMRTTADGSTASDAYT